MGAVEVVVPVDGQGMDVVHLLLGRFWEVVTLAAGDRALPTETWRAEFAIAVVEIAANIVRYAYPNRVDGPSFTLALRLYLDHIEAVLTDEGIAFAPPAEVAPAAVSVDELAVDLLEGGYGLWLAHSAVDEVGHERTADGANRWRLAKRLPLEVR